jgi:hypothetical protein
MPTARLSKLRPTIGGTSRVAGFLLEVAFAQGRGGPGPAMVGRSFLSRAVRVAYTKLPKDLARLFHRQFVEEGLC